jgi:hypothetical protein
MFASGLEQSHVPLIRVCRLFLVQRQQTVSFTVWTSSPGNEVDSVPSLPTEPPTLFQSFPSRKLQLPPNTPLPLLLVFWAEF